MTEFRHAAKELYEIITKPEVGSKYSAWPDVAEYLYRDNCQELKDVISIDLADSYLKIFPEELTKYTNFVYMVLTRNSIKFLPESFGNLINIKSLTIVYNYLESLPESFGNLINLNNLNLSQNYLKKLPESFGNLINLNNLDLRINHLETLPENFTNLINLGYLDLSQNYLTSLPKRINKLSKLQSLGLGGSNKIESFPLSFGYLHGIWIWSDEHKQAAWKCKSLYCLIYFSKILGCTWPVLDSLNYSLTL